MEVLFQFKGMAFFNRKKRKSVNTTNYRYYEFIKRIPQEVKEILMIKF